MKKLFLMGMMALAANAALIPELQNISAENGNFRWTYEIALSNKSQLTAGQSPAEFVVIYDFGGYVAGSITADPTQWSATTVAGNGGPIAHEEQSLHDGPLVNLVWTYIGPSVQGSTNPTWQVSALSTRSATVNGYYQSQTSKCCDVEGLQGDNGPTVVPAGQGDQPVPEPMSMALIGGGLSALALLRRRKK